MNFARQWMDRQTADRATDSHTHCHSRSYKQRYNRTTLIYERAAQRHTRSKPETVLSGGGGLPFRTGSAAAQQRIMTEEKAIGAAIRLQAILRMAAMKRRMAKEKDARLHAAIALQAHWRGAQARAAQSELRAEVSDAAILVQAHRRGFVQRRRSLEHQLHLYQKVVKLQARWRMLVARRKREAWRGAWLPHAATQRRGVVGEQPHTVSPSSANSATKVAQAYRIGETAQRTPGILRASKSSGSLTGSRKMVHLDTPTPAALGGPPAPIQLMTSSKVASLRAKIDAARASAEQFEVDARDLHQARSGGRKDEYRRAAHQGTLRSHEKRSTRALLDREERFSHKAVREDELNELRRRAKARSANSAKARVPTLAVWRGDMPRDLFRWSSSPQLPSHFERVPAALRTLAPIDRKPQGTRKPPEYGEAMGQTW